MKIGIIGAGNVGGNLGQIWAGKGHDIFYGVRDRDSARTKAALQATGSRASAGTVAAAARFADVIVLAMPWNAAHEVIRAAGDLRGKTLVDCTNPLKPDLSGLAVDSSSTSAAEQIAGWATGAHVVKAFNTIGAGNLLQVRFGNEVATMPICGDFAQSKNLVGQLVEEIGFELIDAGPLRIARLLESLAMLWIHLAVKQRFGADIAFKMLRR